MSTKYGFIYREKMLINTKSILKAGKLAWILYLGIDFSSVEIFNCKQSDIGVACQRAITVEWLFKRGEGVVR